jgi:hypothetical protein
MKASELRIENLIYDTNGRVSTVEEIKRHPSCERDYDYIVSFNELGRTTVYVEELKPIPLTEELLLKFGFEINELSVYSYASNGSIGIYKGSPIFHYVLSSTSDSLNGYIYHTIEIKYVHQLQNLYFDLIGEELTIK